MQTSTVKMTMKVADVLDGRTFLTNSGMTVLLKGVVVPGLLSPAGRRAKARLEELILHKHVECEDVEDDVDGRLIAEVRVEGEHVNEVIRRLLQSTPAGAQAAEAPGVEEKPKKVEIDIDDSAFGAQSAEDKPKLKYW